MRQKKEGMSKNTKITAFCDRAANCWSIVDSLESHCKSITKILDWYHIRQAYDKAKVALPDYTERLDSSKYKAWHGKTQEVINKLDELAKERFSLRIKRGSGLNPKPHLFRENKISIARVKTVLNEINNGK